jgi:hypothetical protein
METFWHGNTSWRRAGWVIGSEVASSYSRNSLWWSDYWLPKEWQQMARS